MKRDTNESDAARSQFDEAHAWLFGPEGRRAAGNLLRRFRFGMDAAGVDGARSIDDLCQEALLKLWQHLERNGPIAAGSLAAYLTKVMHNLLVDAMRGRSKVDARLDDAAPAQVDDRMQVTPGTASSTGDFFDGRLAAVRAAIEQSNAPDWVRAGALAYVTVLAYPDAVPPDHPAPRPKAGARPDQAALWPALWFAGQRDRVFAADGGADTPNIRKARERAGRKIRELFDRALSAANLQAQLSEASS